MQKLGNFVKKKINFKGTEFYIILKRKKNKKLFCILISGIKDV